MADPGRPEETSDHFHVSFVPIFFFVELFGQYYFTNLFLFFT